MSSGHIRETRYNSSGEITELVINVEILENYYYFRHLFLKNQFEIKLSNT